MINGIMTLSGAWHKLRDDPILKFLIVSLSFYGMSTFEGPMMSIKTVNALSHYTDWTVGHVHSGALGWVGLVSMGALYHLIPRMFGRKQMYSVRAIELHFWIATIGIVLYIAAMWIAGVMQGLMWRAVNPDGTLVYSFVESVKATSPSGHERIETSNFLMIVLILLTVAVGGLVEIVPLFFQRSTTQPVEGLKPYTALQVAGRDIYVREGCYNCHSQMIRPFRAETLRYGPYSVAGEFVYDHPFQWGSKRTGPDLARVGGKYSDEWHRLHLVNPRDLVPESNMPAYPWLQRNAVDGDGLPVRMKALRLLGAPYSDDEIAKAPEEVKGKTEMEALIAYLQVLGTARK
jgi:cytochrome c oxidase cbb3-type subunit 2